MKWDALEYPTSFDTSVTGMCPSTSRSRARSRRTSFRNWYGVLPVTSRKRWAKADGLRLTCSAMSATVNGCERLFRT
jgi:hypothetical protein